MFKFKKFLAYALTCAFGTFVSSPALACVSVVCENYDFSVDVYEVFPDGSGDKVKKCRANVFDKSYDITNWYNFFTIEMVNKWFSIVIFEEHERGNNKWFYSKAYYKGYHEIILQFWVEAELYKTEFGRKLSIIAAKFAALSIDTIIQNSIWTFLKPIDFEFLVSPPPKALVSKPPSSSGSVPVAAEAPIPPTASHKTETD